MPNAIQAGRPGAGFARSRPSTIPKRSWASVRPLSLAQQRCWVLNELMPGSPAYNISLACHIAGVLDEIALHNGLQAIQDRHESLRSHVEVDGGRPSLHIAADLSIAHERRQSSDRDEIEAILREEARRAFDLSRPPLWRTLLVRIAPDEHVLVITAHHLVSDGWSFRILLDELSELYTAARENRSPSLSELSVQYTDCVEWQRSRLQGSTFESLLGYWREQCRDIPLLEMPTDRARLSVQSDAGGCVALTISKALVDRMTAVCEREGVTMFMLFLSALYVLLARHSGQHDIAVGTPVSGRSERQTHGVIGLFVNTIVLRTRGSGDETFRELMRTVRETAIDAYEHQSLPFELLVDEIVCERDLSRNPLFQVMLVMQNLPASKRKIHDLLVDPQEFHNGTAKMDLTFAIHQTERELRLALEYNSHLFDVGTGEQMLREMRTILEYVTENLDERIASVPLLDAGDRRKVLQDWNATAIDYGSDEVLHRLIEAGLRRANRTVVIDAAPDGSSKGSLTGAAVERRANQLARHLLERGASRGKLVAVCLERSSEMVIALYASLKTGAAYVPLDPDLPRERLSWLLADTDAWIVITEKRLLPRLPIVNSDRLIVLDDCRAALELEADSSPAIDVSPDEAAYVIYTSGTTGKPKGVVNTHRGICNRLLWMQSAFPLTADDRVLHKTPIGFDVSVWELFWPLLVGSTLVIAAPGSHKDTKQLANAIALQHITTVHFVPIMLRAFLRDEAALQCRRLKRVICSGDVLPRELEEEFFRAFDCELYNLYGPTEAAIDATAWQCRADSDRAFVPIGRPIANTEIYLLDSELQPVPVGVPGQIYIGGCGLAMGYLNRPDLTALRFIPHPFSSTGGARLFQTGDVGRYLPDGAIHFLGRRDHQIKIRGMRVELEELEAELRAHLDVQDAAVKAIEGEPGNPKLAAYVVTGNADVAAELREFLRARVPEHLVPATIVRIDALPLGSSGKLDRSALPSAAVTAAEASPGFVAPRTNVEQVLAAVWCQVLGLDRIGIHDRFFDLGGDSIRVLQAIALCRPQSVDLTIEQCLQFPTIAELAAFVDQGAAPTVSSVGMVAPFALLDSQERVQLEHEVVDAFPLSRLQSALLTNSKDARGVYRTYTTTYSVKAGFRKAELQRAVDAAVRRHGMLRTRVDQTRFSRALQLVQDYADVPVRVTDLSHLSNEQQEATLQEWLRMEETRRFDWAVSPLLRVNAHVRSEERFELTLTEPWLDGWSVAILGSEILSDYAALLEGGAPASISPPRVSYADFVALEQSIVDSEEARRYWSSAVAQWPDTFLFGASSIARADTATVRMPVELPLEITDRLRQLARLAGVALKSVLLAAHVRVISLLTGQSNVVSTVMANGRPELAESDRMVGLFLNAVPVHVAIAGDTWRELAHEAQTAEQRTVAFRRYPYSQILEDSGRRLCDTLFNFTSFHPYANLLAADGPVTLLRVIGSDQTYFALTAHFGVDVHTQTVKLVLDFNTASTVDSEARARVAGYYQRVLQAMAADVPDSHVWSECLLDPHERRLLDEWNMTSVELGADRCVHECFEQQALLNPERIALTFEDETWTFGRMRERVTQLTTLLSQNGVGNGSLVAINMRRSPAVVVAMLAVLKSGGAFVPLDAQYPTYYHYAIAKDAGVCLVLTDAHTKSLWTDGWDTIRADEPLDRGTTITASPRATTRADDPAYVMYTSGSTGAPKGVITSHRSILNRVAWMWKAYPFGERDVVCQKTALAFVDSIWELFGGLLAGVPTVVLSNEVVRDPGTFIDTLRDHRVTRLTLVPAVLAELLRGAYDLSTLAVTHWTLSGEALPAYLVNELRARVPNATILNLYGSTEVSADVTCYEVEGSVHGDMVPIGRPIANTTVYVVDESRQRLPIGVTGELLIGGAGLAVGYWRQPDLTKECFIRSSSGAWLYCTRDLARFRGDGVLEYVGRKDRQVKIGGVRIEPEDLEIVLSRHPGVRRAAVTVLQENRDAPPQLIAYVEPAEMRADLVGELRSSLARMRPRSTMPSRFELLDALPKTASGKIDYTALPAPSSELVSGADDLPQTSAERALLKIWREVLRKEIGVLDNLFVVGGDSLTAVRMIAHIRKELGVDVSVETVFDNPSVRALAAVVMTGCDDGF